VALKLYGTPLSPYFCRVWFAALAKGIDLELEIGPPDVQLDLNRRRSPTGKIPFIEDNDVLLYESEVIVEYLEDKYPEPSLLPVGASERAQSRLISRLVDLYVLVPVHALVPQIRAEPRDEDVVERHLGAIKAGLAQIDATVSPGPWCMGAKPVLADCALAAALWYLPNILRHFSTVDLREGYSRLTPYWNLVQTAPVFADAFTEMAGTRDAFRRNLVDKYGDRA
jgi:glutathione S-transferase